MLFMKTASQYRAQAREVLGGNVFSNKWLMAVVVVLVYTAILGAATPGQIRKAGSRREEAPRYPRL